MGFPLHSNGALVGFSEREMQAEFQPSDSGTKSQPIHAQPVSERPRTDSSSRRFITSPSR